MIHFDAPIRAPRAPRAPRADAIAPMINLVFLLLIFFLMTATLAPPDPLEITPPEAEGAPARPTPGAALHLAADGRLAYGAARGDAVFAAIAATIAAATPPPARLTLRADAAASGREVARVLERLAGLGVVAVDVVASRP